MLFRAYTKDHGARDEADNASYANPYILSYLDVYVSISIYLETRLSIPQLYLGIMLSPPQTPDKYHHTLLPKIPTHFL